MGWFKRKQRLTELKKVKLMGYDCTQFTITVTMKDRWIPHFLAMLKYMQQLGGWGSSRLVSFMSDGDGDFRPKFEWNDQLKDEADPVRDEHGSRTYDAG